MKKYMYVIAVLAWALVIFYLSHQPASSSNELSKGVTRVIVENIEIISPEKELDFRALNSKIRKSAHFFFYFILGMLIFTALHYRKALTINRTILAFFLCVLYAILDEGHQLFIDGRGAQVRDVIIDSAGALVGIVLALAFRFFTCTPYRQSDKID